MHRQRCRFGTTVAECEEMTGFRIMAAKKVKEAQGEWLEAVERLNEPGDKYVLVGISLFALIPGINHCSLLLLLPACFFEMRRHHQTWLPHLQ